MSTIGSPIQNSLAQVAQAQQQAGKTRDRNARAVTDAARRFQDLVDLRVAGVETTDAVRPASNEGTEDESSAQEQDEQSTSRRQPGEGEERPAAPGVDVKA